MIEVPNERLSALNAWISVAVVDGARAHYDRTNVLSSEHTQIEFGENDATVTIPHRDLLKKQYEDQGDGEAVGGTCRELAQWAAVNLVKGKKLVDSAEVYACATDSEAHYVVVAMIDGQKYLVDIAYSQPVLEAIPVDGNDHVSDAYSGAKGTKQAFSGYITYRAIEREDGILFTVKSPNRSTEFPLRPLTDELDAQVPGKWAHATGSGYATRVRENEYAGDERITYRVDSESMGPAATLQSEFARLHEIATRFGAAAIKVIFSQD